MLTITQQLGTNTQQQQQDEKEIPEYARKVLNEVQTDKKWYYTHNKKRKKLKRLYKECSSKFINDASKGDLCYGFKDKKKILCLGRKAEGNFLEYPFLIIEEGKIAIQTEEEKCIDIIEMNYAEFYKHYKSIVGKNSFLSFFENAWDGLMSITQVPRQMISRNHRKATSKGGRAANIATRVFLPVIAPVLGAYEGAKALKDKLIPTKEELKKMWGYGIQDLSDKYAKTDNKNLKDLQTSLIAKWKSGALRGMSYNNLKEVLKENQMKYRNTPKKNLNDVNNANTITATK